MGAWSKLSPLQRKLEMKRRAQRRRENRLKRNEEARALLAETNGSALAFPQGKF